MSSSFQSVRSTGSRAWTLSPTSPARSWSRKFAARTHLTSWHSTGRALATDTARGRLLPASTAMILAPLAATGGGRWRSPLFGASGGHIHERPLDSASTAGASAGPALLAHLPTCRSQTPISRPLVKALGGHLRAAPGSHQIALQGIGETGSSALPRWPQSQSSRHRSSRRPEQQLEQV